VLDELSDVDFLRYMAWRHRKLAEQFSFQDRLVADEFIRLADELEDQAAAEAARLIQE
jgi:hypothetical protein